MQNMQDINNIKKNKNIILSKKMVKEKVENNHFILEKNSK